MGTQAIQYIRAKGQSPSISTIAHSSYMDIFQNLAVDMDTEGRYGAEEHDLIFLLLTEAETLFAPQVSVPELHRQPAEVPQLPHPLLLLLPPLLVC